MKAKCLVSFLLILLTYFVECSAAPDISYEEVTQIGKAELWAAALPVIISSDEGLTVSLWKIDSEFPRVSVNGKRLKSIIGIGFGDIGESPVMLKLFSNDRCFIELSESPLSIIENCEFDSGVTRSVVEISTDHKGKIKFGNVVFSVSSN